MAADTFDPFLGLILQGTGNNNNAWGTNLNASALSMAARAVAGNIVRAVTGGTLDLSGSPPPSAVRQDIDYIQIIQGVLVSNQTIIVPNISKSWIWCNQTTGAFQLFIKTTAGTATNIPQGTNKEVFCDGSNGMSRLDKEHIGNFVYHGGNTAFAGALFCAGQSLLRTDYPDLFAAIGTLWGSVDGTHFTLPNLQDTGRYLRSAKGGLPQGTYQSNAVIAHNHAITGAPSVGTLGTNDPGNHTHSNVLNDLGHTHNYTGPTGVVNSYVGGSTANAVPNTSLQTSLTNNSTPMSITNAAAGSHTHTITGAPGIGTLATSNNGAATETRPETAVVLISIKY